jgi:putative transcriptional regulator
MKRDLSDHALLKALGERLHRYRLNRNLTQVALAKESGVSERTINRVEHGHSTQLSNFIRLLRSLGLLDNINSLVPEPAISPIEQLKLQGKSRKRASSPERQEESEPWSWGEAE